MTIDSSRLLKSAFTILTLGMFAIAIAAPITMEGGIPVQKAAYAKKGADDGRDAKDDHGGHGTDDAPDDGDVIDDDGTADQGPGDN